MTECRLLCIAGRWRENDVISMNYISGLLLAFSVPIRGEKVSPVSVSFLHDIPHVDHFTKVRIQREKQ